MKKHITLLSLAAALPLGATAFAQDAVVMDAEPAAPTVEFGGFVDTSVFVPLAGFEADGDEVVFGLDQVELDVTATPTDGLTIQGDFEYFPASTVDPADGAFNFFDSIVEQGFIDYEGGSGAFVRVGKANAPIGAEAIDAPDLYQYSQGQLFTNATPSNLTGIFGGYRSDSVSAQAWITNDWDTPGTPRSATPGLRLEYAFDAGHVGLASTYGPAAGSDPYAMVDVDTGLGFGDLTILGEFNFGTSDSLESLGFLLTLSYAVNDWFAATLRGDYLTQTTTDAGVETDASNTSITAAGLFTLADNFGSVVEIRADMPDGGDTAAYGAVEFLAWW